MLGADLIPVLVWPIGFGLFGFIEPCAIGATLLFIKTLENKSAASKLRQVFAFTLTRMLLMGLLGVAAALIGSLFLGLQKAIWIIVGIIYAAIGLLYLFGKIGWLMRSVGPHLTSLSRPGGSAMLGAMFGLNIPACAGPLLLALLASSAAGAASGANIARGFVSLALFGLALSLPLVAAVLFAPARRALDWLAALSRRLPFWTGLIFLVLGVWSIWFGLFVTIE